MRSRASQARALFRIINSQSSSSSSTAATTASSAATATAAARSTRSAAAAKRRRNVEAAASTKVTRKSDGNHQTIYIKASPSKASSSIGHSLIAGLEPVSPPISSLSSVATQAFFALDRPLLEHQVVASSNGSGSSSSQGMNALERDAMAKVQSTIENAKDAIMEAASRASRLSADELSKTTFIISGALNEKDDSQESTWPKRVASLDHNRFVKLIDSLSKKGTGRKAVQAEAQALEEEEASREDVESAVANAIERGEDPSVAKSLGSEADLVVLGEPSGPNPAWPRGVATFLAEKTRALEAPEAPSMDGAEELESGMESMEIEELAKHFAGSANAFTMQNMSEDDPNLMLSHAMVQATLPSRLKWDAIVAKMDAATNVEGESLNKAVDVSALNADLLPAEEGNEEETNENDDEVHLDSVKRKRKKKMRKHKYRKFRKATRVERNRLKK